MPWRRARGRRGNLCGGQFISCRLSRWSKVLKYHLLSKHLPVAVSTPGMACGCGMGTRWINKTQGVHSRISQSMKARTLVCWQVVPGMSYGKMTSRKKKEHLELPGETSNHAVLPASTRLFFCTGSPSPVSSFSWPSHSFLPACGVWLLSPSEAVAAKLLGESSPPTGLQPLHERNRSLRLSQSLDWFIHLF